MTRRTSLLRVRPVSPWAWAWAESLGAALTAYRNGPEFLMVKAFSDFADGTKNDSWHRYAAEAAARFAVAVLAKSPAAAKTGRTDENGIDRFPSEAEPGSHKEEGRMRAAGIRRSQPEPRGRPSSGWEALTPIELRVAFYLADGLSTSGIAAKLLLSRPTVQTTVSHILAKLGARSRAEIASEAAKHRADDLAHATLMDRAARRVRETGADVPSPTLAAALAENFRIRPRSSKHDRIPTRSSGSATGKGAGISRAK